MQRFVGKAGIITGAAFGIGRAIAEALVSEGASVVLSDIREDELAETVKTLGDERATGLPGDVRSPQLQQQLVETCIARFGGVHFVVNNAANQSALPIEEVTEEHWAAVQTVNVNAALFLVQKALPHLGPGSAIVNISSLVGGMALPGRLAYNTSKTAIMGLTRALAVELGMRGIRVNAVCPGHIMSVGEEAWQAEMPEWQQTVFKTSYALGRVGKVGEVARAVAFLASDDASFITGQSLFVDGGMSILCPEEAVFRAAGLFEPEKHFSPTATMDASAAT